MKKIKVSVDIGKLLLIAVLSWLVSSKIFLTYKIIGESMYPTYQDGQYGIALRTNLNLKNLERFQVVIVNYNGKMLIKRLVGLPGETVKYTVNTLYIDEKKVNEDFISNDVNTTDFEVQLSENEYFVMGDNREHSLDSRKYGAFGKEDIIAILF